MRSLLKVALLVFLICSTLIPHAGAEAKTDALYVSIGQAISAVKAEDRDALSKRIATLAKQSKELADSDEKAVILKRLSTLKQHQDASFATISADLTALSTAVRTLEETMRPAQDATARTRLLDLHEVTKQMRQADASERKTLEQTLLKEWTARESVVREESIGHYGKVEMALSAIRIAQARQTFDQTEWNEALDQFDTSIDSFVEGDIVKTASVELTDLIRLLDQASDALVAKDLDGARSTLTTFIAQWPSGEGAVRTRDSALYTQVETDVPLLLARLNDETRNATITSLQELSASLGQLTDQTSYTFVDAMLVMVREGLEALLIISALVALTRKANLRGERHIWFGAVLGLLASGLLALIIQFFFSTALASVGREQIEGWTGLFAVLVMLLVGNWLHSKTAITSRQTQLVSDLSRTSLFIVSFLTIFREGAETLLFYVGMAPAMTPLALGGGILAAILFIGLVSIAVIYFGVRLPIRRLFLGATILIYVMAFKILGVSLHALQLTGVLPVHPIALPPVAWIGFYPTIETVVPQVLVGLIIILTVLRKQRRGTLLKKVS